MQFEQANRKLASQLEQEYPGTAGFLTYLDESTGEVTLIHIFPDAQAMAAHMEGVSGRIAQAEGLLEFGSHEVYGQPGEPIVQAMRNSLDSPDHFRLTPNLVNGYLRLPRE